jgi:hypothetical protein
MTSYEDFDRALLPVPESEAVPAAPRRSRRALFALAAVSTLVVACASLAMVVGLVSSDGPAAVPRLGDEEVDPEARVFDESGRYIMREFDRQRPMSSFLPGVAGLWGLPMWVFYVNRGQAVATFGVENKDTGILMFQTAEKAYQATPTVGFRTMFKGTRSTGNFTSQPFDADKGTPRRDMFIGSNEVEIEEVSDSTGLQTNVLYFTVPNEDFSALVRRVTVTNVADTPVELEMIDGLAKLEPFGATLGQLQSMGRTMEGWMHVYNYEEGMTRPFFHLVTSPADTADVQLIKRGHFAIAFVEDPSNIGADGNHALLPIICDQQAIFGLDTTLTVPGKFFANGLQHVLDTPQSTTSRTPGAFAGTSMKLAPGESATVSVVIGHAADLETFLQTIQPKLLKQGFVTRARAAAQEITHMMTDRVSMTSGVPLMDNYVKQNYLDNSLRGGMPFTLGGDGNGKAPKIYHAFSRIHGDLERDYNNFVIEPSYFSQGPGNFRDVNQNRRCDVLQLPAVHDFNVRQFMSYVQADGYNQLTVATAFFKIRDPSLVKSVTSRLVAPGLDFELVTDILAKPFRPGQLFSEMSAAGVSLMLPREELLELVTAVAEQVPAGQYSSGQGGFWTDHWTYNLDLFKNFLAVYPDEKGHMLFDSMPIPFFLSGGQVRPRHDKYVLADNEGTVRQYDAVTEPRDKAETLQAMWADPEYVGDKLAGAMWQRDSSGEVFRVPIIAKLVLLSTCKFAILDPLGMGIEMEAGKPGWNDAMNGLPGLFGSEMPAAYELYEILDFTAIAIDEAARSVPLPEELSTLLDAIDEQLAAYDAGDADDFAYWDGVRTALEDYREATSLTFSGESIIWPAVKLGKRSGLLGRMLSKQEQGMARALSYAPNKGHKVSPTYFRYTVREPWLRPAHRLPCAAGPQSPRSHQPHLCAAGPSPPRLRPRPPQVTDYELVGFSSSRGLPTVRVKAFAAEVLPLFLEGPVRHMKTLKNAAHADKLAVYKAVKNSTLRDGKLGMYKISESLKGQPFEVGRMMAFNPGWLENESIWMHMSYKWYLEVGPRSHPASRQPSRGRAAQAEPLLPAPLSARQRAIPKRRCSGRPSRAPYEAPQPPHPARRPCALTRPRPPSLAPPAPLRLPSPLPAHGPAHLPTPRSCCARVCSTSTTRRSARGWPASWTPRPSAARRSRLPRSSSRPPSPTPRSTARASSRASRAPPPSSSRCGTS